MLKSTLLSLATIVSAVMAGSVKVTSPKPGNVWEIGKEVDITWYAITYQRASCFKRAVSYLIFRF
jgi:hypothetical protein